MGRFFCLVILCGALFPMGCHDLGLISRSDQVIGGRVVSYTNQDPVPKVPVGLYTIEKISIFHSGWVKKAEVFSDEMGIFEFSIKQKGPYQIRWENHSSGNEDFLEIKEPRDDLLLDYYDEDLPDLYYQLLLN